MLNAALVWSRMQQYHYIIFPSFLLRVFLKTITFHSFPSRLCWASYRTLSLWRIQATRVVTITPFLASERELNLLSGSVDQDRVVYRYTDSRGTWVQGRPSHHRPKVCWQLCEMFCWLVGWYCSCPGISFFIVNKRWSMYNVMAHPVVEQKD